MQSACARLPWYVRLYRVQALLTQTSISSLPTWVIVSFRMCSRGPERTKLPEGAIDLDDTAVLDLS